MPASSAKDILGKDFQKIPILKSATGVAYEPSLPDGFSLKQNYPDPFNPTTRIAYSIPSPQQVSLKVYDAIGKLVTTLVNQYQAAGNYTVQFNATNLSSGNYIYTLETQPE